MKHEQAIAHLKIAELTTGPSSVVLCPEDQPVLRVLPCDLLVAYMIDEGDHFSYVQNRDLEEERVSADTLHQYGIANLATMLNDQLQIQQTEGIFAAFLDGNFEASLLLVDALWNQALAHVVDNDFVCCIPARDVLAFCDSASEEGIAKLQEVVERIWPGGDHLLTDKLYRREDHQWVWHTPS